MFNLNKMIRNPNSEKLVILGNESRKVCCHRVRYHIYVQTSQLSALEALQEMLHMIDERIFLFQGSIMDCLKHKDEYGLFHYVVNAPYVFTYEQFNPPSISSVVDFIQEIQGRLQRDNKKLLMYVEEGKKQLTNAVFLMGAYLILKHGLTTIEVQTKFGWLQSSQLDPYKQADNCLSEIPLHAFECLQGLEKGKSLEWIEYTEISYMWGRTDIEQYRHYSSVANGFLHQVVPGKLIAFPGPHDIADRDFFDESDDRRIFSPSYYVKVLRDMGVTDVIQLNEQCYTSAEFTSKGLRHHIMTFEDGTCPPDEVVTAFFNAVDSAAGAVGIHCRSGLGRTGTLIALYLMRSYDFTAQQAMGWLRIMRPGSVIGPQQRYLCRIGAAVALARSFRDGSMGPIAKAKDAATAAAASAASAAAAAAAATTGSIQCL